MKGGGLLWFQAVSVVPQYDINYYANVSHGYMIVAVGISTIE